MWIRRAPAAGALAAAVASVLHAAVPASTTVCPAGHYRSSIFLWDCAGGSEASDVMVDPQRPNVMLEIPAGVAGLSVSAEDDDKLDLTLLDASDPTVIVADNVQGLVNDLQSTGSYRNMTLTCLSSQGAESWKKTCSWSTPTSVPLVLKVTSLSGGTQLTVARLEATFASIAPCPSAPHGCRPYDEAEACEDALAFSKWARGQYEGSGGEEAAWLGLADGDAFVPQVAGQPAPAAPEPQGPAQPAQPAAREVPFWAWPDVWRTDLPGIGKSFHYLDKDGNSFISKAEFVDGYRLSDVSQCGGDDSSPLSGLSGQLATWQVSLAAALAGLCLWLGLCVLVLRCCRKPPGGPPPGAVPYHELRQVSAAESAARGLGTSQLGSGKAALLRPPDSSQLSRLAAFPAVALAVEEHPASLRFHQARILGYHDVLSDGFRAVFSQELLLVDARKEVGDAGLRGFMSFLRGSLPLGRGAGLGEPELVVATAKAVAAGMGGGLNHEHVFGESLESRWRTRYQQLHLAFPRDLPIGLLLGGRAAAATSGGSRGGGGHEPGAGLRRHRAVLFKYVCDALRICTSALVWDTRQDVVLNLAWAGGRPVLVDVTEDPGQLSEDYELHQLVLQLESERHDGVQLPVGHGGHTVLAP